MQRQGICAFTMIHRASCHLTVLALSIVLAGCGSSDRPAPGEWSGSTDTLSSGRIVVHNPDVPGWGDTRIVLQERVRLGTLDGGGPELFDAPRNSGDLRGRGDEQAQRNAGPTAGHAGRTSLRRWPTFSDGETLLRTRGLNECSYSEALTTTRSPNIQQREN